MVKRAVIISALFTLLVLVIPARGLTFLWDDWQLLDRAREPLRWLEPVNEHWKPLYCGLFALEHAVFGANHTFFLLTTWAIHVVNLFLLGSFLEKRTQDERAPAIAVLAFGVATSYREVLWWACLGGLALSFTVVLLGLHATDRVRRAKSAREERLFLGLAALAAFVSPLLFGSGIALGPLLALDLAPRRRALVPLAGFLVYALLYAKLGNAPAAPADPHAAARFFLDELGLGLVRRTFLPMSPIPETPVYGALLAVAYVAAVAALSWKVDRNQLACAQLYLILVLVPIALARSRMPAITAAYSRYQYFPALAWTWTLALALAKRDRRVQLAAALVVVLLAALHAQDARRDGRPYAPPRRVLHPALVQSYVEVARVSSSALDRIPVPVELAWPGTTARSIVRALDR